MQLFGKKPKEKNEALPTISARELKQRLERGEDIVLLDVRQPNAYADFPGAVPGSIRIPPAELPARYEELPRDKVIVPY